MLKAIRRCSLIQDWTADKLKYIQFLQCTAAKMAFLKATEVNDRFKQHFRLKKLSNVTSIVR